jgi:hypothetical protein
MNCRLCLTCQSLNLVAAAISKFRLEVGTAHRCELRFHLVETRGAVPPLNEPGKKEDS